MEKVTAKMKSGGRRKLGWRVNRKTKQGGGDKVGQRITKKMDYKHGKGKLKENVGIKNKSK